MQNWGNPSGGIDSTSDLFQGADGHCGTWSRFMIDILRARGIEAFLIKVLPPIFFKQCATDHDRQLVHSPRQCGYLTSTNIYVR